jgi:hypothetical protein
MKRLTRLVISTVGFALLTPLQAQSGIDGLCQEWAQKLRTVEYQPCLNFELKQTHHQSSQGRPLVHKEFIPPSGEPPKARILAIGGVHGDEYSAISIGYLWMQALQQNTSTLEHHWIFLPLSNPDGLFLNPATRQNANGVDLNRNFPTPDWENHAHQFWRNFYKANPRRYPGPFAGSEPETQWQVEMIQTFQPDVIISIHAPYGLLDYDGPDYARPDKVGHLQLRQLGTFPGSLGRFAGEMLNIPVLTIELESAGRLPKEQEILKIWEDIYDWIDDKINPIETDF